MRKLQLAGIVVLLLAVVVALVLPTLHLMLRVAAGFSSHMHCSIRYVEDRTQYDTTYENAAPEFKGVVRWVLSRGTTVHEEKGEWGALARVTVTTTLPLPLGYGIRRVAVWQPAMGCTLAGDDDAVDTDGTDSDVMVARLQDRLASSRPAPGAPPSLGIELPFPRGERVRDWAELVAIDPRLRDVNRKGLKKALRIAFRERKDKPRAINTYGAAVAYRGQLVAERYAKKSKFGVDVHTPVHAWSITKSLLSALIGARVAQGKMALSDHLFVPEQLSGGTIDARRLVGGTGLRGGGTPLLRELFRDPSVARNAHNITVLDALHMSTGLEFEEKYSHVRLYDPSIMLFSTHSHASFAGRKAQAHAPGTHFSYSSGTSNLLSRHLRLTFDSDTEYRSFARDALFGPAAMRSAQIETDASGDFVGSSFAYATVRDWVRFGLLLLNGGRSLDGSNTQVLAEGWAQAMLSEIAPACRTAHKCGARSVADGDATTVAGAAYGRHVWFGGTPGSRHPAIKAPAMLAMGFQGQLIAVVPSRDLVVVRFGLAYDERDFPIDEFVNAVIDALPPPPASK